MDLNYINLLREVGTCFTVNEMLAAKAYKLRWEKGLTFFEFNYMIMQAYDFYMLPYAVDLDNATDNVAYQFNVPEEGRGYILTFRPMSSVEAQTTYQIQGLERDAMYKLEVADSGDTLTLSGADLMDKGLLCEYPDAAFSMLIYYNKI
jgi:hypothetical protein